MPSAYATADELRDLLGRTPANAEQMLIRASRDVDQALLTALYDPTAADVIDALREATLEQVAGALEAGDVSGTGIRQRPGSFTIGRLSVQQAANVDAAAAKIAGLWPQAYAVLQQAGLTGNSPQEPWPWIG